MSKQKLKSLPELSSKPQTESRTSELESANYEELKRMLSSLRAEIKQLKREAKQLEAEGAPAEAKVIVQEAKTLETTVGSVLLDIAEQVPILGNLVKWFR